ncbi:hypothetical protein [Fimbriiglobus ruber]|uniref:Uncharacterized protein n=1 Tax=Fimbriiglobus ruber TaxID=1908690 RepID=A0A225DB54_9BACT|nr:hypothetical protein [Fimbriiglobus ruber]OWK34369.1 hypothetical protein FRUB_10340 [Fimbriiglobus ruber]
MPHAQTADPQATRLTDVYDPPAHVAYTVQTYPLGHEYVSADGRPVEVVDIAENGSDNNLSDNEFAQRVWDAFQASARGRVVVEPVSRAHTFIAWNLCWLHDFHWYLSNRCPVWIGKADDMASLAAFIRDAKSVLNAPGSRR